MKRLLLTVALTVLSLPVLATDVGVSISVGQPGFYGRLDIGNYPPPVVMYPQPVVVVPVPVGVVRQPMYLHVPPGHQKNWRRYCSQYEACGYPVYFVQTGWYNNVYVPQYQQRYYARGKDANRGNGKGRGKGKD
jgi:hypothetical protein